MYFLIQEALKKWLSLSHLSCLLHPLGERLCCPDWLPHRHAGQPLSCSGPFALTTFCATNSQLVSASTSVTSCLAGGGSLRCTNFSCSSQRANPNPRDQSTHGSFWLAELLLVPFWIRMRGFMRYPGKIHGAGIVNG